jgi:hypothetical protein
MQMMMVGKQNKNIMCAPMDHRSFRDQLAFSIGFAVTRSRDLLRRILKEHGPDQARQMFAERVVEHLEASGFEIDEADKVLKEEAADAATPDPWRVGACCSSRFPQ